MQFLLLQSLGAVVRLLFSSCQFLMLNVAHTEDYHPWQQVPSMGTTGGKSLRCGPGRGRRSCSIGLWGLLVDTVNLAPADLHGLSCSVHKNSPSWNESLIFAFLILSVKIERERGHWVRGETQLHWWSMGTTAWSKTEIDCIHYNQWWSSLPSKSISVLLQLFFNFPVCSPPLIASGYSSAHADKLHPWLNPVSIPERTLSFLFEDCWGLHWFQWWFRISHWGNQ